MDFLGVSGMHYSGVSLKGNRIILAEDSVVFNKLIPQRVKELLEIDIEIPFDKIVGDGKRKEEAQEAA